MHFLSVSLSLMITRPNAKSQKNQFCPRRSVSITVNNLVRQQIWLFLLVPDSYEGIVLLKMQNIGDSA